MPASRRRLVHEISVLSLLLSQGCGETTGLVLRPEGELDASAIGETGSIKPDAAPGADASDRSDGSDGSDAGDVITDACRTCSGSIIWNTLSTSMLWGGDGGRQSPTDTCAAGEAVVGYLGTVNGNTLVNNDAAVSVIGSIQTICGHLLSDDSATVVTWGPSAFPPLPTRGMPTTMPWAAQCDTDEVVVALRGGYGDAFDQINVICGKIQLSSAGARRVATVDPTAGRLVGHAGGDGFSATYDFACGPNKIVIGSLVRAGTLIDAFGVTCAAPSFVPYDGGSRCCALGMDRVPLAQDSSVSQDFAGR